MKSGFENLYGRENVRYFSCQACFSDLILNNKPLILYSYLAACLKCRNFAVDNKCNIRRYGRIRPQRACPAALNK